MSAVRGYAEVAKACADAAVGCDEDIRHILLREAAVLLAAQGEQLAAVHTALDDCLNDPADEATACRTCLSAIAEAVGR